MSLDVDGQVILSPLLHGCGAALQPHEGSLAIMSQPFCEDEIVLVRRTLSGQEEGQLHECHLHSAFHKCARHVHAWHNMGEIGNCLCLSRTWLFCTSPALSSVSAVKRSFLSVSPLSRLPSSLLQSILFYSWKSGILCCSARVFLPPVQFSKYESRIDAIFKHDVTGRYSMQLVMKFSDLLGALWTCLR